MEKIMFIFQAINIIMKNVKIMLRSSIFFLVYSIHCLLSSFLSLLLNVKLRSLTSFFIVSLERWPPSPNERWDERWDRREEEGWVVEEEEDEEEEIGEGELKCISRDP